MPKSASNPKFLPKMTNFSHCVPLVDTHAPPKTYMSYSVTRLGL